MKFVSFLSRNVKSVSDRYYEREKEREDKKAKDIKERPDKQNLDLVDLIIFSGLFGGKQ